MYQAQEAGNFQKVAELISGGNWITDGILAMEIKFRGNGSVIQGIRFNSSKSPDVADLTSSKNKLAELAKKLINSKGKNSFTTGDGNGGLIQWRLQGHQAGSRSKEKAQPQFPAQTNQPPKAPTALTQTASQAAQVPASTSSAVVEVKAKNKATDQTNPDKTAEGVFKIFGDIKVLSHKSILVSQIRPYVNNPRKFFDQNGIAGLAGSLQRGQRQDIIVMELKGDKNYQYELVDGERRWRAAIEAGVESLDAKVLAYMDEKQQFLFSAVSNFGREGHTEFEEAETLARIKRDHGLTEMELAYLFAKSQSWVNQRLSLFKLDGRIQEMLKLQDTKRPLGFSVAQLLTKIQDSEKQVELVKEIIEKSLGQKQAMNLIRFRAHQDGFKVGSRKRTPRDDYRNFQSFLERVLREGGVFIEMPEEMFVSMFKQRTFDEGQATERSIKKIIKLMEDLKERMRSLD